MPHTLTLKQKIYPLDNPKIMGIINLTRDSFYAGSRYYEKDISSKDILQKVEQMIEEGMDILDIGAVSTRPGAELPSENTEWERLSQSLKLVVKHFPMLPISIDTYRSNIARYSVECGASMINDISGGIFDNKTFDNNMFNTIGKLQVPYVLMHTPATPENMQLNPEYSNVTQDIIKFFSKRIALAKNAGISDIIIDPGFGFGKTLEHNYQLLAQLRDFKVLDCPILVGMSRKSMLYKPLKSTPEHMLNASTVVNTLALTQGANILRVHDVKAAVEASCLFNLYNRY